MSEQPTIFQVFADVKRDVTPVGKDSVNEQQRFKFRGVDAVVNAAAKALDKHGVIIAPRVDKTVYGTVEVGQKRTPMAHVQVEVTYTFYGPAGDSFSATVPGEAMDSGDKGTAKAMSVAFRICLIQTLNLPTGDQDPESQTYERSPGGAAEAFENAAPAGGQQRQWKPPQGRKAQQSRQAPAAQAQPKDDAEDAEWVRDFTARATSAANDAELRPMQIELARAVHARKIIPQTANELGDLLKQRAAALRDAA